MCGAHVVMATVGVASIPEVHFEKLEHGTVNQGLMSITIGSYMVWTGDCVCAYRVDELMWTGECEGLMWTGGRCIVYRVDTCGQGHVHQT